MDKMEKVSWRVEPQLKSELEAAARDENTTVAEVLRRASVEYLKKRRKKRSPVDTEEQARLRAKLMTYAGSVDGSGESATNENVRKVFAEKFEADAKRRNAPRPR
jgi:hypothetical protein